MGVQISLRPRKRERDRMEIEVLDQWACLLEPPGEACGESQRTTVRLSNFTVDDQPQAPETHTPRGLHLCLELVPLYGACCPQRCLFPTESVPTLDCIGVSRPTRRFESVFCLF